MFICFLYNKTRFVRKSLSLNCAHSLCFSMSFQEEKMNVEALSRAELLTLLSILEGELEAQDVVIHTLRVGWTQPTDTNPPMDFRSMFTYCDYELKSNIAIYFI